MDEEDDSGMTIQKDLKEVETLLKSAESHLEKKKEQELHEEDVDMHTVEALGKIRQARKKVKL